MLGGGGPVRCGGEIGIADRHLRIFWRRKGMKKRYEEGIDYERYIGERDQQLLLSSSSLFFLTLFRYVRGGFSERFTLSVKQFQKGG